LEKRFIALCTVIAVAAVVGVVYEKTRPGLEEIFKPSPEWEPRGPEGEPARDLPLGTPVMYGDIEICVTDYKFTSSFVYWIEKENRTEEAEEGKEFFWIYVISTNKGDTIDNLWDPLWFDVWYEGQRLEGVSNYFLYLERIEGGYTRSEVGPGESKEGWVLVEIPKGLDRAKMRIASFPGGFLDNRPIGLATWKLES